MAKSRSVAGMRLFLILLQLRVPRLDLLRQPLLRSHFLSRSTTSYQVANGLMGWVVDGQVPSLGISAAAQIDYHAARHSWKWTRHARKSPQDRTGFTRELTGWPSPINLTEPNSPARQNLISNPFEVREILDGSR
jgi:hypothetical protein